MIEVNRQGDVWVFAEQQDGKLSDVPLELLGKACELAKKLNVKVAAVLSGHDVKALSDELMAYGAEKVYLVQDKSLEHYQTGAYTKAICQLIEKHEPQIVLYGATAIGRDLAPRVASAMWAGLTADCTDLRIGDYEIKRLNQTHKDLLLQIRPAFGGNIIATIVNYDRWPQMATVREGVMAMPQRNGKATGEIIEDNISFVAEDSALRIIDYHRQVKKVDLKSARIIVAGGAGIGSKEGFEKLWALANVLGGAPAGSRAAVDLGFIDHDHQVGQTGTTVRPALYFAIGISGAIQHLSGMAESAKIIAINDDPDAPIFKVAHYGIVGNFNDVVPKLIKAIRKKA